MWLHLSVWLDQRGETISQCPRHQPTCPANWLHVSVQLISFAHVSIWNEIGSLIWYILFTSLFLYLNFVSLFLVLILIIFFFRLIYTVRSHECYYLIFCSFMQFSANFLPWFWLVCTHINPIWGHQHIWLIAFSLWLLLLLVLWLLRLLNDIRNAYALNWNIYGWFKLW